MYTSVSVYAKLVLSLRHQLSESAKMFAQATVHSDSLLTRIKLIQNTELYNSTFVLTMGKATRSSALIVLTESFGIRKSGGKKYRNNVLELTHKNVNSTQIYHTKQCVRNTIMRLGKASLCS